MACTQAYLEYIAVQFQTTAIKRISQSAGHMSFLVSKKVIFKIYAYTVYY